MIITQKCFLYGINGLRHGMYKTYLQGFVFQHFCCFFWLMYLNTNTQKHTHTHTYTQIFSIFFLLFCTRQHTYSYQQIYSLNTLAHTETFTILCCCLLPPTTKNKNRNKMSKQKIWILSIEIQLAMVIMGGLFVCLCWNV